MQFMRRYALMIFIGLTVVTVGIFYYCCYRKTHRKQPSPVSFAPVSRLQTDTSGNVFSIKQVVIPHYF